MPSSHTQKYLFSAPTSAEIQKVARQIILAVKAGEGATNMQLAALIGADDAGTIQRLEEMRTAKVPASLFTAIGAQYGDTYIQPYMGLMGLKAVPQTCTDAINALPAVTALAAKLALAANGKTGPDHVALGGMLQELRDVDAVISHLRARAADMGMSA